MNKYASLIDESIKVVKSSEAFSDQEKISKMSCLLDHNYQVFQCWIQSVDRFSPFTFHESVSDLRGYCAFVDQAFKDCKKADPNTLQASPEFSVFAATLGSTAAVSRHVPKTLEDFFTLLHQNQLFIISHLHKQLLPPTPKMLVLPKCVTEVEGLVKGLAKGIARQTGIDITDQTIILKYNLPLSNHSISIDLEWNTSSKKLFMHVKCFGEGGRTRWKGVSMLAQTLNEAGLIKLKRLLPYTEQEVQFSVEVSETTQEMVRKTLEGCVNLAERSFARPTAVLQQFSQQLSLEETNKVLKVILYPQSPRPLDSDLIFKPFADLLLPHVEAPIVKQLVQKISTSYGSSNEPQVLCEELSSLRSFCNLCEGFPLSKRKMFTTEFEAAARRFLTKNLSCLEGTQLLLSLSKVINDPEFLLFLRNWVTRIDPLLPQKQVDVETREALISLFLRLTYASVTLDPNDSLVASVEKFAASLTPSNNPSERRLMTWLAKKGRCKNLIPKWIEATSPNKRQRFIEECS